MPPLSLSSPRKPMSPPLTSSVLFPSTTSSINWSPKSYPIVSNHSYPPLFLLKKTGYVEGRQILDGIILAHKVIHSLKVSKKLCMMLKLDLSKAFDKLKWNFIGKVLEAFGFHQSWIRWITSLISTPLLSVLINGVPSKPFNPSRGIRQGDLLSPFLFILMSKGLGHVLSNAKATGSFKGLSLHDHTPLTHPQFVDDNILMGHPSI